MGKRKTEVVWRATADRECDACGSGTKGCSGLSDDAVLCRGEFDPAVWHVQGEREGFTLLRRVEDLKPPRNKKTATKPRSDAWREEVVRYSAPTWFTPELRAQAAAELYIPPAAFDLIPQSGMAGVSSGNVITTHPETDADGNLIGLGERDPNRTPKHKMRPGGNRGLSQPTMKPTAGTRVYLPEGPTDTLAMLAAGLFAVGRPGCEGKVEIVIDYCRKHVPADCEIILPVENDQKPDGKWPGRDGTVKVAKEMATALKRPVRWAIVPDGIKDPRLWLAHPDRGDTPYADRGGELGEKLFAASVPELPGEEIDDPALWADPPDNPHRLAAGFLASLTPPDEPSRLRYWREQFREWHHGAYHTREIDDVTTRLTEWLRGEFDRVYELEVAAKKAKRDTGKPEDVKKRAVTVPLVRNVVAALKGGCRVPSDVKAPAWLDDAHGPDPHDLVPVRNGLVDVTDGRLHPATAAFFSFAVSPFDYDPAAPDPAEWLRFLNSIWGDDPESIATLQEWFGYLLTPDTSQQKMLFVKGPTRAGKGTIAHVLQTLVGGNNVIHPELFSLSDRFGLAPLFDKSVALVADLRLTASGEHMARIVGNLLKISGEDTVTSDRKNLSVITDRLPTRLVIMSNELPDLGDASGALFGRIILLRLTHSFLHREDKGLRDRLTVSAEMAGIMNWAIEGLSRLRARGAFRQPQSGKGELAAMRSAGANVATFVREKCILGPNESVAKEKLYEAWKEWCEEQDLRPGAYSWFTKRLYACVPNFDTDRPRIDGIRVQTYIGIRVRKIWDEDEEPSDYNATDDEPTIQADASGQGKARVCPGLGIDVNPCGATCGQGDQGKSLFPHTARENEGELMNGDIASRATREIGIYPGHPDHVLQGNELHQSATLDKPGHTLDSYEDEVWLYVSSRLDLQYLPSFLSGPICEIEGEQYYRMSPRLLRRIEMAADEWVTHKPPDQQIQEYARCMNQINAFCRMHWAEGQIGRVG